MNLDVGTYVTCQVINGKGVGAGIVENMTHIGISIRSIRHDELPTHVILPWTNVKFIHIFDNEEDMQKFYEILVQQQ